MSVSRLLHKAVILAAGLGSRMRQADAGVRLTPEQADAADRGLKSMMPVGRPFLDYGLSALADAGYRHICLVIGPNHQSIREYYETLSPRRLTISWALQAKPLGTADAVAAARSFAGDDDFLVLNSDNYYPASALAALGTLDGPGIVGFLEKSLLRAGLGKEQVDSFPSISSDGDGNLAGLDLVAKEQPRCVSMNCWRFSADIFTACGAIRPSSRGELELPDAVRYSVERLGTRYRVLACSDPVLDISRRSDIARVKAQLESVPVEL
jgi:glucose-1-phosphate thymidylyltransferase